MPLIECSECGKKVSDTVDICIHCCKPIKKNGETNNLSQCKDEKHDKSKSEDRDFKFLSHKKQIEFEKRFVEKNDAARKYRRKGLEFSKFTGLSFSCAFWSIIQIIACRYAYNEIFNGNIYNEDYLAVGAVCCFSLMVLGILLLVFNTISRMRYNHSIKKYVYLKMFSEWLEKECNISYIPDFFRDKEKEIYDSIDTRTMKL
ncbi:MAG: hypothetical protein E7617_04695 [Ruminococcaceae bacterium]|nr:hypothetical protein [Oscillospiraceae bacterium]